VTATASPVPAGDPTPTGSIYDLGYRRYTGQRLGRSHAVRALFWYSLRATFGIGRGTRAKLAPITLAFLAVLPAIAIIAAQALLRQFPGGEGFSRELPIRYETYASTIGIFIALFCAAQAPELFGRDQRHGLLGLYFARALRRTDYSVARLFGFMLAVLLVQLVPQLLLFTGRVLLSTDLVKGINDDLPDLAAATAQAMLTAGLLGGVSMAVSAFTPRRAYAVAGIIAVLLIPTIVTQIVIGLGAYDVGRWAVLLSPTSVLDGTNAFLFDIPLPSDLGGSALQVEPTLFLVAAGAWTVGAVVLCFRRFWRLTV